MFLLRKTHTCGEPRCIWLRPPAPSSSQTSLWPLWRRVKCVSRRSLAMPTPWESVPLRCTPRKESGREYPALHPCVEHNTLLRSTSGEFLRFCRVLSLGAAASGRRLPAALRLFSWRCLSHWRVRSVYLLTQNPLCPDPSQESARAEQLESGQLFKNEPIDP